MMKKWKAALAAASVSLLFVGCKRYLPEEKVFAPEGSSIYVTGDGKIFSATVEDYETDRYSSEGLEAFVTKEVASYNESLGFRASAVNDDEEEQRLPVTVVSCQVAGGKAAVVYEYLDSASFLAFAQEYHDDANQLRSFGIGSASSGRVQGWFEDGEYVKPGKDGEVQEAEKEELERLNKERMLLVETSHPVTIQIEGEICYMTRNVVLSGGDVAQVPAGKHYIVFK